MTYKAYCHRMSRVLLSDGGQPTPPAGPRPGRPIYVFRPGSAFLLDEIFFCLLTASLQF